MLALKTASSSCVSQSSAQTSSRRGDAKLGSLACSWYAAMLARLVGSTSLGSQVHSGSACAKNAACWPVPLATSSSTPPRAGKLRCKTSKIGSLLRSGAGQCCRIASSSSGRRWDVPHAWRSVAVAAGWCTGSAPVLLQSTPRALMSCASDKPGAFRRLTRVLALASGLHSGYSWAQGGSVGV